MEPTETTGHGVSIDLLDSATGQPQQTWRFESVSRLQIGRAKENDVVIANPYVSRSHAVLERTTSGWTAISISTQLLYCGGRKVSTIDLTSGTIFNLGSNGSCLRFNELVESPDAASGRDYSGTLAYDESHQPVLQLDRDQLAKEVTAITDGDFFQNLARNARALREVHHPPS